MGQVLTDFEYTYKDTAATSQIFTGQGVLVAIVLGETANNVINIIDHTSGSTVNIGQLKASIAEGRFEFNCVIKTGLRIIAAGNSKFTVIWKK